MNWRNVWRWWIFYLIAAPLLAFVLMGIVGAISKEPSGQLFWNSSFDWETGLKGFVAFAILACPLFVASLGIRYLLRRFRPPN